MLQAPASVSPPPSTFVVSAFDYRRLRALVDLLRERTDDPSLDVLELELELAAVVEPHEVPADVVTMNSTVEVVDLGANERRTFTVVFPASSSIDAGRVSILAPLGAALLGARVGDEISWATPRGSRRARVERIVYQPEAAGDFHL